MQVRITDSRPDWMVREDTWMECMHHCSHFKFCKSRVGKRCKVMGGQVIPKIREVS